MHSGTGGSIYLFTIYIKDLYCKLSRGVLVTILYESKNIPQSETTRTRPFLTLYFIKFAQKYVANPLADSPPTIT